MPLPNVVIAGAPRCGTTSLFRWAAAHPEVSASRIKETRYLIDKGYSLYNPRHNFAAHGLEGYARLFPHRGAAGKHVYLEATPDYLYQQTARRVLADLPTKPVTIFLLRNPVERMLSLFQYAMNNVGSLHGRYSLSDCLVASRDGVPLGDAIIDSAFAHSVYYTWLEKWISAVGRSRTIVYFFDDLVSDPGSLMRDFCHQVKIDAGFYEKFTFRPENQSYTVRSAVLARAKWAARKFLPANVPTRALFKVYRAINVRDEVRAFVVDADLLRGLRDRFAEPNRRLAELLGRELPKNWD